MQKQFFLPLTFHTDFFLFIKLAVVGLKQTGEDLLSLAAAVYSSHFLRAWLSYRCPRASLAPVSTLPVPIGMRENGLQPSALNRVCVRVELDIPSDASSTFASPQPFQHAQVSIFTSMAGMWDGICNMQSFPPQV